MERRDEAQRDGEQKTSGRSPLRAVSALTALFSPMAHHGVVVVIARVDRRNPLIYAISSRVREFNVRAILARSPLEF